MSSLTTVSGAMLLAAFSMLALFPASAGAISNEASNWSDDDYALYPQFCRARKLREPELALVWEKKMGPKNFIHIHHFCNGLKALNLSYASFQDKQRRLGMANTVINNFEYIIAQTERNFYLRPEAFLNLGRGYAIKGEFDTAAKYFNEALKLNPKLVDAWVALSDLYHQNGERDEALRVLEKALEVAGEHKKITLRIEDMKKEGVKK